MLPSFADLNFSARHGRSAQRAPAQCSVQRAGHGVRCRLQRCSATSEKRHCVLYDLHDVQARAPGLSVRRAEAPLRLPQVPYARSWEWQRALVRRRLSAADGPTAPDALLVLQHEPVYTLGTGSSLAHLRFDPATPPFPLHRTERGGEATYHGPGQLVLYPILDLRRALLGALTVAFRQCSLRARRTGSTRRTCTGTCGRWKRSASARWPSSACPVRFRRLSATRSRGR